MYTHGEIRAAIKTLIETAGGEVGVVYDWWVIASEQDDLHLAFADAARPGQVLGWQFDIGRDEPDVTAGGAQEQTMDTGGAVMRVIGWNVEAYMSAITGVDGRERALDFADMIERVVENFRNHPFQRAPIIDLPGVETDFEDRSGLQFPQLGVTVANGSRCHLAQGILYTRFACEPENGG